MRGGVFRCDCGWCRHGGRRVCSKSWARDKFGGVWVGDIAIGDRNGEREAALRASGGRGFRCKGG